MIQRRDRPPSCGSAVITLPTLVARIQRRRFAAIAGPTMASDAALAYTSAVSMKLTPASKAEAMIFCAVAGSVRSPNIMVPRQSVETSRPLEPRRRYAMGGIFRRSRTVETRDAEAKRRVPQLEPRYLERSKPEPGSAKATARRRLFRL